MRKTRHKTDERSRLYIPKMPSLRCEAWNLFENMNKRFFLPTKCKILLLVVLLIATIFIPKYGCLKGMLDASCSRQKINGIGYPMFYGETFIGDTIGDQFSIQFFILNLLIYYAIACGAIFCWNSKNLNNT